MAAAKSGECAMVQGCSRSDRRGAPRWPGTCAAFLVFIALSSSTGPADSGGQSGRFVAPSKSAPARLDQRILTPPTAPAPAVAIQDIRLEIEMLHEAPMFATTTVRIAPQALVRQKKRIVMMDVTAYCACKKCCGSHAAGLTASGRRTTYNGGHFVAADIKLFPFGTKLIVPGYADSNPVEVIDRGGAIRGNHIDVFMPT